METSIAKNETMFYLQDSRCYVGNDVLWWMLGGGYTTDLRKAEVFSKEAAQAQHNCRQTDIPWLKSYIDKRTRPAVDMQYIHRDEALAGTGIVLIAEPPHIRKKAIASNCGCCGRFVSPSYQGDSCPPLRI